MGPLLVFGFVVTAVTVPFLKKVARKYGFVSRAGGRRKYGPPIPLLGGVAIFLPFALVLVSFFILSLSGKFRIDHPDKLQALSLLLATAWILALGTLDDRFVLGWRTKLIGQFVGALIVVAGGHSIATATVPLLGPVDFGWFGVPLFIVAVIAITNAINLVDGIDGLAGGICFFAAFTSGIIGLTKGDIFAATIGFTVSGSMLGFLMYNFPPATIFMGDGGSMMSGFLLGVLATSSAAAYPGQRLGTSAMILIPFLPFGIPLFEVALSVARRWLRGQAIFLGDGDHLHHRLVEKLKDPGLTVVIFYLFAAASCALTLLLVLGIESDSVRLAAVITAVVLLGGAVASMRLYKVHTFFKTLKNRPHFRLLGDYLDTMKRRMGRAGSTDELLGLLESGGKDLRFESVEILYDGRSVRKWSNPSPIHPENPCVRSAESFQGGRLVVKWSRPLHKDGAYNEYLKLTWHRIMVALDAELTNRPDEFGGPKNSEVFRLIEKASSR